jgi:hypothetical protein
MITFRHAILRAKRLCVLILPIAFISGCKSESKLEVSSAADSAEATSVPETPVSAADKSSPKTSAGSASNAIGQSGATASTTAAAAASDDTSEQTKVNSKEQIDPQAAKPATVAKLPTPTQQQLDRWQLQEHEPMSLVASDHYTQMGFTERIVPLPNNNQYMLGGNTITLWTLGSDQPDAMLVDWRSQENSAIWLWLRQASGLQPSIQPAQS